MSGLCRLCQDSDDLRVSHVLPRFVGRYLKNTSATGFLTAVDRTGKPSRAQDLAKTKLLCDRCESILCESETFFANTVFYPLKQNTLKTIPVDEHFARFAVSVSLRVLWIMQIVEHPLAEKWKDELSKLETEWRNYLLRKPDFIVGDNSHHILLCSKKLLAVGLKNSPHLIYNIFRSSAYYLFEKFGKAYVFANLAGVQIISMISPPDLPASQGTQVYPNQTFGVVTPSGIGWGGYFQNLLELATKLDAAVSRVTDGQQEMINCAMNKDPGRAVTSEDALIIRMQQELRDSVQEDMP